MSAPRLGALPEGFAEHVVEIDHADMRAWHAGNFEAWNAASVSATWISISLSSSSPSRRRLRKASLVAGLAFAPTSALSTRSSACRCAFARTSLRLPVAHEADRRLDKIAHDLIHVAADIADFGELRRLNFKKGRIGELCEPARNLGLADAGWADHQDILRENLLAHILVELLPAPAIAKRNGDRALWRQPGPRCSGRVPRRFPSGRSLSFIIFQSRSRLSVGHRQLDRIEARMAVFTSFTTRSELTPRTASFRR